MNNDPILVIQLQRLGDLILTFPLLLDLKIRYPENPLWLVAEPAFFTHLMPFTPDVTFFPPDHLKNMTRQHYKAIFNLSSRPDAAICTASASADNKFGLSQAGSSLTVNGFWQLYRLALTHNNRHNAFHWADLNRLDLGFPFKPIQTQRLSRKNNNHIGLFLGASEASKRPSAGFWTDLTKYLAKNGYKPILLGGPAEKSIGEVIEKDSRFRAINFSGKTNLTQLAALMADMDLIITPDTGPMHLADWIGASVLNLSVGNVQPLETGPVSAGQWVVQANMSCSGCWQCHRAQLYCQQAFNPGTIFKIVNHILHQEALPDLQRIRLFNTARAANGLYELQNIGKDPAISAILLNKFWQNAFLYFYDSCNFPLLTSSAKELVRRQYPLINQMIKTFDKILKALTGKSNKDLPDNFWQNQPWHSRLFAGFIQMRLQNDNFSSETQKTFIEQVITLKSLLKSA